MLKSKTLRMRWRKALMNEEGDDFHEEAEAQGFEEEAAALGPEDEIAEGFEDE